MRKIFQNPIYLIAFGALLLIMVLFVSSSACSNATEEPLCNKSTETNGSELLWESFSLQFVPATSPY